MTGLYQAHAAGLVKLALVMLGDRTAAEDVVQEAFFGLYRNWGRLSDPDKALAYVRGSVLNGGTVKSSVSRALASLGTMLREGS